MTTYKNSLTYGGGIFIDSKYPPEQHVHGYNYLGPWTRTDIRLTEDYKPKQNELPINKLDEVAMNHDIAYAKAKKEYNQTGNKQEALKKIHNSDKEFIKDASKTGALGKIASGIIYSKMKAEENGIINSKTFSGMGNKVTFKTKDGREIAFTKKHDPTERLKKLAGVGICKNKPEKKRKINGGFAPVLIPVLSAVAGSVASKLFDLVREKISGKGYNVDPELYKTDAQKRAFLKHVLY